MIILVRNRVSGTTWKACTVAMENLEDSTNKPNYDGLREIDHVIWKELCQKFNMEPAVILDKALKQEQKEVNKLLRFINGMGLSDQLKAFCVKEAKK